MYNARPGLLIGFHGCEAETRNALLQNPDTIKKSDKPYDWLGHGMYFWENNADRAFEWAKDKKKRGEIATPMIKACYSALAQTYLDAGEELPKNRDLKQDQYKDKILRELDCKVIEFMHDQIIHRISEDIKAKGVSENKLFDSARGAFTEGGPAF